MSPIYEYRCGEGHVHEDIRAYGFRDRRTRCPRCHRIAKRIPSAPHVEPDGVHSYAPNVGDPVAFEKRRNAMKDGVKVYPKEVPPTQE
jgi:hypothetical protein